MHLELNWPEVDYGKRGKVVGYIIMFNLSDSFKPDTNLTYAHNNCSAA